jgi:hypothetical protein
MMGIVFFSLSISSAMAETRVLPKDTKLHPQGWSVGDFIEFRKNTVVTLNDLGEVVSGTLDKDTFLLPLGWKKVINDYYYTTVRTDMGPFLHRYYHPFIDREYSVVIPGYGHLQYEAGTAITFNEQGEVIAGTLANRATLRLVNGKYGFVTFKGGTALAFHPSGTVSSGVLDADTYLRPVGWQSQVIQDDSAGFIKFSKGKAVTFNGAGEVMSGTIKEKISLRAKDGTQQTFAAGSAVDFTETNSNE